MIMYSGIIGQKHAIDRDSVKNELVNKFGIDAGKLETDGKGESTPIAANDSAVNKARKRRVEFIKL